MVVHLKFCRLQGPGPALRPGAERLRGRRRIHSNPQGVRAAPCPKEHPQGQFADEETMTESASGPKR